VPLLHFNFDSITPATNPPAVYPAGWTVSNCTDPLGIDWDDHSTYHKVEKFRVPQADGQAHVRFRFSFAATDSWAWGIDSFGLYSSSEPPPLKIDRVELSGGTVTLNWNGTGGNLSGLQKTTSLTSSNWVHITGTIGETNYTEAAAPAPAFYRAVRF
jgi:hypothetical protein